MLNNVTLQGRLGADPELRATGTGKSVTSFAIAVDRDYNLEGNKETDWFDIVCWNKTAEFAVRNFAKGQQIAVVGRLQNRSWTDKDGNKRRTTEVVANNVYFCGGKENGVQSHKQPTAPAQNFDVISAEDDELPFWG